MASHRHPFVYDRQNVSDLLAAAQYSLSSAWRRINKNAQRDPRSAFERVTIGERKKKALWIDVVGEDTFKTLLKDYKHSKFAEILDVHGEESLRDPSLNLTNSNSVCVLADVIDGTDLLERGLSNWCSAAVLFYPQAAPGQRILASLVASAGELYFATSFDAFVQVSSVARPRIALRNVSGPAKTQELDEASVCFYGQKAKNFAQLSKYQLFEELSNGDRRNLRLYTLAGIPMMLKLIDHRTETARGIDAVFDVMGQKAHDVVPGAFLALKAGAVVKNLATGRDMTLIDLENSLLMPAEEGSKLKYVMASTPQLADRLLESLQPAASCEDRDVCTITNTPLRVSGQER